MCVCVWVWVCVCVGVCVYVCVSVSVFVSVCLIVCVWCLDVLEELHWEDNLSLCSLWFSPVVSSHLQHHHQHHHNQHHQKHHLQSSILFSTSQHQWMCKGVLIPYSQIPGGKHSSLADKVGCPDLKSSRNTLIIHKLKGDYLRGTPRTTCIKVCF